MTHTMQRIELCKASEVPDGAGLKVETHGLVLAVFALDDGVYVIDDACTHGPGSLSEGLVCEGSVECDFHNGAFDIRTGAVTSPPCLLPVKSYPTTVEDGVVFIDAPGAAP